MASVAKFLAVVCLSATAVWCGSLDHSRLRERRDVSDFTRLSPSDRPSCKTPDAASTGRVNTTERLRQLRLFFSNATAGGGIDAYIIPSQDAHNSEYPADYDLRRGYISGFSGSAGTAVVTRTKAALWTDGRYHLEGEQTLDCNWILMKSGVQGVPTIQEWLQQEIQAMPNPTYKIGASPFFLNSVSWEKFGVGNITMAKVDPDLIDQIWTTGRPNKPNTTINALPLEYAGKRWEDKIMDLRGDMTQKGAAVFVVTSLDETAWLFNARAKDISYNPFFISYAIVEHNRIRLYLNEARDKLTRQPTDSATTQRLYEHLNTNMDGSCTGKNASVCVEVLEYDSSAVVDAVRALGASSKVWVSFDCNFAIVDAIPEANRIQAKSMVALRKSMKNERERQGMINSHVRDAKALISFLAMLEKEVKEGKRWTEVSAAQKLKEYRMQQEHNRGLSFPSISGVGPNGAVIHYRPAPATDRAITTREMYLLDSGGQYLDGTTDVTRTLHFGTPTDYEKECYTRVLMGHIDLAMTKWPRGLYGREIDAITRRPLWDAGLIYLHGTGHGIGAYLSVHEGPGRISMAHAVNPSDEYLREYMFFSDEPGYYEDGSFGIRIETIVMVDKVPTKYNFQNTTFLGFKPITMVPLEPHLIQVELLNDAQLEWLRGYHRQVEETMRPHLQGEALTWMTSRTQHQFSRAVGGAAGMHTSTSTVVAILIPVLSLLLSLLP